MEQDHRSKSERARFPWATCLVAITALWIVSDVVGIVVTLVRHAVVLAIVVTIAAVIVRIVRARNQ